MLSRSRSTRRTEESLPSWKHQLDSLWILMSLQGLSGPVWQNFAPEQTRGGVRSHCRSVTMGTNGTYVEPPELDGGRMLDPSV